MSFNRTIVELKCYLLETETLYVMAFNRTIVELKHAANWQIAQMNNF